jgi:hypothetical protein
MADNTTFVLPQWFLPREPEMQCQPHSRIVGMLAAYNIVSVIISLTLSSSFFFRQTQWILGRGKLAFGRLKKLFGFKTIPESPTSYYKFPLSSFAISVLGSILISLSAPLLAGISITNNHPTANHWVLIEQWATRPRATFFIWTFSLLAVFIKRGDEWYSGKTRRQTGENGVQDDGFLTTAASAVASEVVVSLFPLKFLINQDNTPRSTFDRSLPCTTYGSDYPGILYPRAEDNNCPDIQSSNLALVICTFTNVIIGIVLVGSIIKLKGDMVLFIMLSVFSLFSMVTFMTSWGLWSSFLHKIPEDFYCVESSMTLNVVYCLLPVFLGIWRTACAAASKQVGTS